MEFGALIGESWRATWRYRSLWVLGFLAGGAGGSCSLNSGGGPPGGADGLPADVQESFGQVGELIAANLGLVIGAFLVAVAIGLALFVAGFIAQGGMAAATVDLAQGRETSLRDAWRAGLRLVWRYVGLWLALIVIAIIAALIAAALVAAVVGVGFVGSQAEGGGGVALAIGLGLVVGLPLLIAVVVGAIALSIVFTYAQRLVYAEDVGPMAALGRGWRLLREHKGQSALVWLVSVVLGIGAGIVGAIVFVPIVAVFAGIGFATYAASGEIGASLIAIAALGLLVLFLVGALFSGIVNTFFWHYWTRAFLRLTTSLP